ncbi:hypothetical protein, conserved [Babesia bigemina]|uniref:C3H1-type domain-containing protein n=1 Tax=Babesia bigemina TaxID=5866 RepID=A0A061BM55_BABBI|nr:hypothetical protein, conserved [Babesia bigemina]CDR71951.1 hypothetical protein, conserved [Babesia bigemina]|eukprot:XP_012770893.1 hypothetical protein, conserved [Babesia bigemina]
MCRSGSLARNLTKFKTLKIPQIITLLCDAVMGFLSGVLGAVKNENEVTTYDKHLEKKLNEVLDEVNTKIGSGRNGLAEAVGAVKGWLEGYELEYRKKASNVTEFLGELKNNIAGKYTKNVAGSAGEKLETQLTKWTETLQSIELDVNNTENQYVNMLDSTLKRDVMREIKAIKTAVMMLKESSLNEIFNGQVRTVDDTLVNQRDNVLTHIDNESATVHAKMTTEFNEILDKVELLYKTKKEHIAQIRNAVQTTTELVSTYDVKYRDEIVKKFEDIRTQVSEVHQSLSDKKAELNILVSSAQETLAALSGSFVQSVKDGLKKNLEDLKQGISDLESQVTDDANSSLVKNALTALRQAKDRLNSQTTGPSGTIATAESKLGTMFTENIKTPLTKLTGEVKAAIGKLYDEFATAKGEDEKTISKILDNIKLDILKIKSSNIGLEGIIKAVGEYAKGVGDRLMLKGGMIDIWVNGIYEKNGHVQGYIGGYVNHHSVKLTVGDTTDKMNAVNGAIKNQINELLRNVKGKKPDGQQKTINANLNEIKDYLKNVAAEMDLSKAEALRDSVEKELRTTTSESEPKQHLKLAIDIFFVELAAIIRQVAEEIESIMQKSKIQTNLDAAISTVKMLDTKLGRAVGKAFTKGLADSVDEAINRVKYEVDSILENTFKYKVTNKLSNAISSLPDAIEGFNRDAVSQITEATRTAINTAVKNVQDAHDEVDNDRFSHTQLGQNVSALSSSITKLEGFIKSGNDGQIDQKLNNIHTELGRLYDVTRNDAVGKIQTTKDESERLMDELRESNQNNLRYINRMIFEADDALDKIINAVFTAVETCRETFQKSIYNLKQNLIAAVEKAFEAVTIEIRKLFARQETAHLSALKTLLSTQLKIISCTVNKDLNTGLKGFLKTLSGDSVDDYAAGYKERPKHLPPKTQKSNLLDPVKDAIERNEHGDKVRALTDNFKTYSDHIFDYLNKDLKQVFASHPKVIGDYPNRISTIRTNLTDLLTHISTEKHIDHQVPGMLETLKTNVSTFNSSHFGNASYPVLDAFPRSLEQFVGELERMYVNGYEGKQINWVKQVGKDRKEELTGDALKCGKVFFSCLPIWMQDLGELRVKCKSGEEWNGRQINVSVVDKTYKKTNALGKFFERCGYNVSQESDSHEGHLRNKSDCTGQQIYGRLVGKFQWVFDSSDDTKHALELAYEYLETYNDVWHIATWDSTRYPCSIFEMLCWLSGLTHNRVRSSLMGSTMTGILVDPEEEKQEKEKRDKETEESQKRLTLANTRSESDEIELSVETVSEVGPEVSIVSPSSISLPAYPSRITLSKVNAIVTHISATSYDVLTEILGTGNAQTMYACEFSNNTLRLKYPTSGDECLDILLDILRRVFAVFRFLCRQCKRSDEYYGWRECQYGMAIPTTKSHCNKKATDETMCQPTCQAKCKPTCQPNCQVNCQPTSALMSYLNDCLPGHLPHQLISVGCKAECKTCSPSSRAMPCLTPLGFRAFSGSTKTGKDLCEIIDKFLNFDDIACLFALVPRPPSTLPEHFQFALSFVDGWYANGKHLLRSWVESSMNKQSVNLYSSRDLIECLRKTYGYSHESHTSQHDDSKNSILPSLSMNTICSRNKVYCAPYLASLCPESYTYFVKKHVDTYVTWVVYLPWVFHQYLESLRDAFQNIFCQDWGCHRCLRADKCKRGKHGHADKKDDERTEQYCQCISIVRCRGTSPTFYKYGFTYGSAKKLELNSNYCSAFFSQLENVIKSDYFTKLFDECDNFLWKIREPFSYLVLALWLLSLLYLLHIMVIRLDLLHIKSHLHSPSSHRIAAQSLLAAGRVNKLNRVFYLQP